MNHKAIAAIGGLFFVVLTACPDEPTLVTPDTVPTGGDVTTEDGAPHSDTPSTTDAATVPDVLVDTGAATPMDTVADSSGAPDVETADGGLPDSAGPDGVDVSPADVSSTDSGPLMDSGGLVDSEGIGDTGDGEQDTLPQDVAVADALTDSQEPDVALGDSTSDPDGASADALPGDDACGEDACAPVICIPTLPAGYDVPDDGVDGDCVDGDPENDEARGYYVDKSFPFGGPCPAPGVGSRACPFSDVPVAISAALAQTFAPPAPDLKREIYVAQGAYTSAGTIVNITQSLRLLGGYLRTDSGPWLRELDPGLTTLATTGPTPAVKAVVSSIVLDALHIDGDVAVDIGSMTLRNTEVVGDVSRTLCCQAELLGAHIDGDVVFDDDAAFVRDTTVTGSFTGRALTIRGSSIGGDLLVEEGIQMSPTSVQETSIGGGVTAKVESFELLDCHVGGSVKSPGTVADSVIEGDASISDEWGAVAERNVVGGDLSVSSWGLARARDNRVAGKLHLDGLSKCEATGNRGQGLASVSLCEHALVAGNTLSVSGGEPLLDCGNCTLIGNLFVWTGASDVPHLAVSVELGSALVRANAFVGFGAPAGALAGGIVGSPVTDVAALNAHPDLPACGKGGNLAFDDLASAGLTVDSTAANYLDPLPGSPLIDGAVLPPLVCGSVQVIDPWKLVCGDAPDIGAAELCE